MDEVNGQYTFDMWVPNLGNANEAPAKKKSSVNAFSELAEDEDEVDDDEEEVTTEPPFRRQALRTGLPHPNQLQGAFRP